MVAYEPSPIPPTILVVDDEEGILSFYEQLLTHRGYEVVTASNGRGAIQLGGRVVPDLVLLDLRLPDMPGTEVCKALRNLPRGAMLPIVVVSGGLDRENVLEALGYGANDFLRKPIDPEELLARVEAHLRARHSRERYARAFETMPHPLVLLGDDRRILEVNRAALDLFAQERTRLAGVRLDELLDPRDVGELIHAYNDARGTGADVLIPETRLLAATTRSGGAYALSLTRVSQLVPEVLATFTDLGERIRVETELARTQEFLESILQNSASAIVVADRKGTILLFNRAAEELSGYRAADVIGKMNIVNFYAVDGARDVMRRLRSEDYGGRGKLEPCVASLISKDKEEIPVRLSASLLYDAKGEEVASMGLFEDLRERIRIEKELAETRERSMEQARREAAQAVKGAASHALSQPLTAILGSVQMLLVDGKLEEGQERSLRRIQDAAERMGKVLRDLNRADDLETRRYAGKTKILDLKDDGNT